MPDTDFINFKLGLGIASSCSVERNSELGQAQNMSTNQKFLMVIYMTHNHDSGIDSYWFILRQKEIVEIKLFFMT